MVILMDLQRSWFSGYMITMRREIHLTVGSTSRILNPCFLLLFTVRIIFTWSKHTCLGTILLLLAFCYIPQAISIHHLQPNMTSQSQLHPHRNHAHYRDHQLQMLDMEPCPLQLSHLSAWNRNRIGKSGIMDVQKLLFLISTTSFL